MDKCMVGLVHTYIYSFVTDCRAVLWSDKCEKWDHMNLALMLT